MSDIYAAPTADLSRQPGTESVGGNVDDALAGNFEVNMLQTLGEAWRGLKGFKLKCHIALLLYFVVVVVLMVAAGVVASVLGATGADPTVFGVFNVVMQLVVTAVMLPMGIAVMIMAMRHANGSTVSAGEVFRHFGSIGKLVLCYILQTLLIVIGLLLLVIPGLYLMFAYMYAMPLIVEKNLGVWQALEASRKALTRVWFRFVGLLLLLGLINLVAAIPLGLGWIWTIPWTLLAMAMVYQKIYGVEAQTLAD